jgi:hypothetical protein
MKIASPKYNHPIHLSGTPSIPVQPAKCNRIVIQNIKIPKVRWFFSLSLANHQTLSGKINDDVRPQD